ncbi:MAG: hypothetical protein ACI8QQ_002295, partial [Psychroserpens sp.]
MAFFLCNFKQIISKPLDALTLNNVLFHQFLTEIFS